MASRALATWQRERVKHIATLLDHHSAIGGGGPGRKWRTLELNWALILQVHAEFQGFCRDLHDECADVFATTLHPLDVGLQSVQGALLISGRKLSTSNATPGNLGNDFGRFGVVLWDAIKQRDARASTWNTTLQALTDARNAIAHADEPKMQELAANGFHLNHLATIRKFRNTANALTGVLDDVMSDHLGRLLGIDRPW